MGRRMALSLYYVVLRNEFLPDIRVAAESEIVFPPHTGDAAGVLLRPIYGPPLMQGLLCRKPLKSKHFCGIF